MGVLSGEFTHLVSDVAEKSIGLLSKVGVRSLDARGCVSVGGHVSRCALVGTGAKRAFWQWSWSFL